MPAYEHALVLLRADGDWRAPDGQWQPGGAGRVKELGGAGFVCVGVSGDVANGWLLVFERTVPITRGDAAASARASSSVEAQARVILEAVEIAASSEPRPD